MDSTFGPPLIDGLSDIEQFRRIARDGQRNGSSVMKGFADDPNVAPYLADISAYLQARTDGALNEHTQYLVTRPGGWDTCSDSDFSPGP